MDMKIKWKKSDDAVSEVIGAILMVGIGVVLFSVLYFIVMSYPFTPSSPSVDIVGTIEGNNIILEHRGGDSLDLNARVLFIVGGTSISKKVGDCLIDSNGNNRWDIGERLVYPSGNMTNLQVEATVVDMDSNSIVMMGVLQEKTTVISLYDGVDSNTSDMDGNGDKGVETNFLNAKNTIPDNKSMTIQEQNTGIEWLSCNALGTTYTGWTRIGNTPYVDAIDYPNNYIYTKHPNDIIGWFDFPSTILTGTLTVNISIYCSNDNGVMNDGADVYVDYTGSGSGIYVGRVGQHTNWQYDTINLGTHTISEVNNLRIYLQYYKSPAPKNVYIDCIRIGVGQPTPNYQLDFEYQWIAAVYNLANKQVCIYVASHTGGTESLLVNYWTGSAWSSLGMIKTTGWSNFTAAGLTSSTYTIQLKGASESGDAIKDSWNIDVIMLHTWN